MLIFALSFRVAFRKIFRKIYVYYTPRLSVVHFFMLIILLNCNTRETKYNILFFTREIKNYLKKPYSLNSCSTRSEYIPIGPVYFT
jgi:hypothetical protein